MGAGGGKPGGGEAGGLPRHQGLRLQRLASERQGSLMTVAGKACQEAPAVPGSREDSAWG